MKEDYRFLPMALALSRLIMINGSDGADVMIDFGTYQYSLLQNIKDERNIYRQLTYEFVHNQCSQLPYKDNHSLTRRLSHKLFELSSKKGYGENTDFIVDEDGNKVFVCDEDINILMDVADTDEQFKKDAEEWYRLYLAHEKFGLDMNYLVCERIIEVHNKYIELSNNSIPTSCKLDILLSFAETQHTEKERILFCYYLAIRSILGRKKICSTTINQIKLRMMGVDNEQELEEVLKDNRFASIWKKWTTPYCFREVIAPSLLYAGYAKILGMPERRKTYISCVYFKEDEFRNAVMEYESYLGKSKVQKYLDSNREERKLLAALLQKNKSMPDEHPPEKIKSN